MRATRPSLLTRVIRAVILWLYRRQGWREVGTAPVPRRFIVIAAPHTSNWDFVFFLGATDGLNLDLSFMGKKSLFRWPFGRAMRELGGIPVDRASSHNYVQMMIDEFARRDEFMLTVAPEGTRGKVRKWKTGFYHIAMGANVPMVCGLMDYAKKTVGLGPAIWPTGDYAADMLKVAEFYEGCTPRHPRQGTVDFGSIDVIRPAPAGPEARRGSAKA